MSNSSFQPTDMDSLFLDIRFALRSLRRRPIFAAVAVATIALSIGAATAIYSVVDGVLFRSLPFRDANRLVAVWQTDSIRKRQAILAANWDRVTLDYTDFITWRQRQRSFAAIGVWSGNSVMVEGPAGPERLDAKSVSPGFLAVLGVQPLLGHEFLPGDDVLGGPHVTLVGYDTWQSRFGGRRDVVGSMVVFEDGPYQIIGVLPRNFSVERGLPPAAFLLPTGQQQGDVGDHNRSFHAIGRLAPGVSIEQATIETKQLLDANYPATPHGVRVAGIVRDQTRKVRAPLLILLGAAGLLVLIACVNVATLLLGEATSREPEMGARIALGASRRRLIRQLLTESILLSCVGAAAGVMLAIWGTKALVALAPPGLPGIDAVHVDTRVLGAALAAALVTGALFGLAPALALPGAGTALMLRAGGQSARGRGRSQRALVAAELALSVVLLVGTGLVSRSLAKLTAVDPGFRADHLLAVRLAVPNDMFDSTRLRPFYDQLLERLPTTPGIVAATGVSTLFFSGSTSSSPYLLEGEDDAVLTAHVHEVQQHIVPPNFFSVMGVPILAGRAFDAADRSGGPTVAIITETAARRDFPTVSAVGQRVKYQGTWRTVVGIAGDTKQKQLSDVAEAGIYTPASQRLSAMTLLIRTRGDPAAQGPVVRRVVHELAPTVAVVNVDVMEDLVRRSFAEERFRTVLITLFGAIAAVLAAVGMFGVTARAVSRRTREVGIRVALGAQSRVVVAMIVNQTLAGVAVGVAAGALAALAASRVLGPYLFGVTTHDPATYAVIVGFLTLVSLVSSWLPARRAGRVEPAIVLRGD